VIHHKKNQIIDGHVSTSHTVTAKTCSYDLWQTKTVADDLSNCATEAQCTLPQCTVNRCLWLAAWLSD